MEIKILQFSQICYVLDSNLTIHVARYSFGTTVLLLQDIVIEILSWMMGWDIKTTQIYAEITGARIEEDMQVLSDKIKDNYLLVNR